MNIEQFEIVELRVIQKLWRKSSVLLTNIWLLQRLRSCHIKMLITLKTQSCLTNRELVKKIWEQYSFYDFTLMCLCVFTFEWIRKSNKECINVNYPIFPEVDMFSRNTLQRIYVCHLTFLLSYSLKPLFNSPTHSNCLSLATHFLSLSPTQ